MDISTNTHTNSFESDKIDMRVSEWMPQVKRADKDNSQGIAIYGAGFVGTWAAQYLTSLGAKIDCFIDRDPNKNGTIINGIKVVLPTDPTILKFSTIYIAARHAVKEVMCALQGNNFNLIPFDGYYVAKNYQKFTHVRDNVFNDTRSIETFNALLLAMLSGSVDSCRAVMEKDMYFALPEFSGTFDEIFVDAGAYVGDTVEKFIWENMGTFRHIYIFEPGHQQFAAMQQRLQRLSGEWALNDNSITAVKAGLASQNGRMGFSFLYDSPLRHGLINENVESESESIEVVTLDSFLNQKPVTFIKADVEGMEMDLLRGAKHTIRKHKPKMALCVYHYPSDLYEIAEYVKSLVPEYKLSLRLHAPIFGDFVLYCYL